MISVVVPVFNEERGILKTLDDIANSLRGFLEYEVIVVNDGSTDGTLDTLKGVNDANVRILEHIENLGYGKSLFDGIAEAKNECVAIIDGDGSYAAADIRGLYQYYPEYDMIVGRRMGKEYEKGIFKSPARRVFQLLAEYTVGKKIPDVNSGLRIFKRSHVLEFATSLCAGFSFTTTLTLLFFLNHYYVKYVPVKYLKRMGKSKVRHLMDSLRAAQIIVQAILHHNPVKLFLLLAFLNSAVGLIVGLFNHYVLHFDFLSIASAVLIASFVPIFGMGLITEQLRDGRKCR
jgi:polyisoprenyl-phosphate glycosyltransferase